VEAGRGRSGRRRHAVDRNHRRWNHLWRKLRVNDPT
jgi:hypothetical protein